MRIKRFIANDMRTALRMVREEQGPDAVILSNRPFEGGVEIVAATDYDESLVQQALRAAAPELGHSASVVPINSARAAMPHTQSDERTLLPQPAFAPIETVATATRADAMIAALSTPSPPPVRDGIAARARAVFRIGESRSAAPAAASPVGETRIQAVPLFTEERVPEPVPGADFRALLARLAVAEEPTRVITATQADGNPEASEEFAPASPTTPDIGTTFAGGDTPMAADAPTLVSAVDLPATVAIRPMQAVASEDPSLAVMRTELAAMRQLMEKQMGEFAIERLRGSPLRAMVFDTLLGYGCDESMAQTIAGRINPHTDPVQARTQMLEELARLIVVNRAEPIDDGGVIALVGPTGAGKTTTAAKLAARFAERHRARDVALVTTDTERLGAREQLHAHGRRLGITVCEAEGPEALNQTLQQLIDYPLVIVDTAGYAVRDRALLGQILWLRTARHVRSLLVLPANAHPHDLCEVVRRYRPASPQGVVLTKVDETGHLGAALSVLRKHDLSLAYTTSGQHVPTDIDVADPLRLVQALEKLRRAADNPFATEDRHAIA